MGVGTEQLGIADRGERVEVGNEQEGVIAGGIAHFDRWPDRPQYIAQMGGACALYSSEDAGHGFEEGRRS